MILSPIGPDREALLNMLSRQVDDDLLRIISEEDYGIDAEKHLKYLRQIRDAHHFPLLRPPNVFPLEVLELAKWFEPDDAEAAPYACGIPGHLMRTFACAALLGLTSVPKNGEYVVCENVAVVQLVASAIRLGEGFPAAGMKYLAWRVCDCPPEYEEEEAIYVPLGLLILACVLPNVASTVITPLIDFIAEEEVRIRQMMPLAMQRPVGLLGLTYCNLRHATWVTLVRDYLQRPSVLMPEVVSVVVRAFADRTLATAGRYDRPKRHM